MFTIDLLKGHGVPIKSKPGGIYMIAISFVVPVALASYIIGNYLHVRILMSNNRNEIDKYESKFEELTPKLKFRETTKRQIEYLKACRTEIADVIQQYLQWSPVLQALVENMPESVVLDKLEAKSSLISTQTPARDDPKRMVKKAMAQRTLDVTFHTDAWGDTDEMVQDFMNQMNYSPLLVGKIEDILPGDQSHNENNNTVHYDITCLFKTE